MNIAILSEVGAFCLLPQIDTNPLLQRQRPNLWHGECKRLIQQRRAVQQLHSELLLQKTNKTNKTNKNNRNLNQDKYNGSVNLVYIGLSNGSPVCPGR